MLVLGSFIPLLSLFLQPLQLLWLDDTGRFKCLWALSLHLQHVLSIQIQIQIQIQREPRKVQTRRYKTRNSHDHLGIGLSPLEIDVLIPPGMIDHSTGWDSPPPPFQSARVQTKPLTIAFDSFYRFPRLLFMSPIISAADCAPLFAYADFGAGFEFRGVIDFGQSVSQFFSSSVHQSGQLFWQAVLSNRYLNCIVQRYCRSSVNKNVRKYPGRWLNNN